MHGSDAGSVRHPRTLAHCSLAARALVPTRHARQYVQVVLEVAHAPPRERVRGVWECATAPCQQPAASPRLVTQQHSARPRQHLPGAAQRARRARWACGCHRVCTLAGAAACVRAWTMRYLWRVRATSSFDLRTHFGTNGRRCIEKSRRSKFVNGPRPPA